MLPRALRNGCRDTLTLAWALPLSVLIILGTVGHFTRQAIFWVFGSTALVQPAHWLVGSLLPQPLASPV